MNDHIIRDCARGLTIANNSTQPDWKLDVTAVEIILQDNGFNPCWINNVNLTIDITKNGLNGLDAGKEAANQWYYFWIIAQGPGQIAGLLSLSSDNPIVPPDYHFKAFVGAIQNDQDSNFYAMNQVGRIVARNSMAVLNSGAAVGSTAVDCSNAIPKKAIKVIGDVSLEFGNSGGFGQAWLRSRPNQGQVGFAGYINPPANVPVGTQPYLTTPFSIPIIEPQTLYYNRDKNSAAAGVTISISGFEF